MGDPSAGAELSFTVVKRADRTLRLAAFSLPQHATRVGVSRQQLKHLRDGGKLVALRLPMHREFVYPAWQFDSATGEPLDGIPDVLEAAEAKLSPLGRQRRTERRPRTGLPPAGTTALQNWWWPRTRTGRDRRSSVCTRRPKVSITSSTWSLPRRVLH